MQGMVIGDWLLVIGDWLLVIGNWSEVGEPRSYRDRGRYRDRLLSGAEKKVFAADYTDYADEIKASVFSRLLAKP
jgi:hypothetical protein